MRRRDGTINPGDMTSFNHYALGAVSDWMHRTIAGLAPSAPGYRRLAIRPRPGGRVTSAAGGLRTPYGDASVAWETTGDRIDGAIEVPPNTTATFRMVDGEPDEEPGSGEHRLNRAFVRLPLAAEPWLPGTPDA